MNRISFAGGLVLSLLAARAAQAHAFLDHSDPAVGSTLSASPSHVEIWYTDDLQPGKCSVIVQDSNGTEVDSKDLHADPKDTTALIVSTPKLPAGTYKVLWVAYCPDSHRTQGKFTFTIKP